MSQYTNLPLAHWFREILLPFGIIGLLRFILEVVILAFFCAFISVSIIVAWNLIKKVYRRPLWCITYVYLPILLHFGLQPYNTHFSLVILRYPIVFMNFVALITVYTVFMFSNHNVLGMMENYGKYSRILVGIAALLLMLCVNILFLDVYICCQYFNSDEITFEELWDSTLLIFASYVIVAVTLANTIMII